MKMYIYVDDERQINTADIIAQGYTSCAVCRNAYMAIHALDLCKGHEVVIDLDHDLGPGMTGYDLCKYIIAHKVPLAGFKIHSMNPVGAFNMRQLLTHYGYQELH